MFVDRPDGIDVELQLLERRNQENNKNKGQEGQSSLWFPVAKPTEWYWVL